MRWAEFAQQAVALGLDGRGAETADELDHDSAPATRSGCMRSTTASSVWLQLEMPDPLAAGERGLEV